MQMFVLDYDIEENAKFYVDKHIVKIPLELGQMISTVYHVLDYKYLPNFIFQKASYVNHPCNIWIRKTLSNFEYACKLGLALYNEYQYRYNKPEKMQRVKKIFKYGLNFSPAIEKQLDILTPFAQAISEDCKQEDTVKAYRDYYIKHKSHLFTWTKRPIPYWVKER